MKKVFVITFVVLVTELTTVARQGKPASRRLDGMNLLRACENPRVQRGIRFGCELSLKLRIWPTNRLRARLRTISGYEIA